MAKKEPYDPAKDVMIARVENIDTHLYVEVRQYADFEPKLAIGRMKKDGTDFQLCRLTMDELDDLLASVEKLSDEGALPSDADDEDDGTADDGDPS